MLRRIPTLTSVRTLLPSLENEASNARASHPLIPRPVSPEVSFLPQVSPLVLILKNCSIRAICFRVVPGTRTYIRALTWCITEGDQTKRPLMSPDPGSSSSLGKGSLHRLEVEMLEAPVLHDIPLQIPSYHTFPWMMSSETHLDGTEISLFR